MNSNGIFINSDAWNFWHADPEAMTLEGLRSDVEFYTAKKGVNAIFYNMNFQRALFDSKVFTPIWKDCEISADGNLLLRGKPTDNSYLPLVRNAKLLSERVPDFMTRRYQFCHEQGVEMWHSMRMNDVHYTPLDTEHLPQHGDLWQNRKDLIRAWYRHTWRGDWHDNGFDYAKQEVYDYHLALLREYLMDFESDGIELDWLRALPVFRPGFDEANKGILAKFMRDARAIAGLAEKKWKHPLHIAIRCPYRYGDALATGMDITRWAEEKLFDVLIPGPTNTASENEVPLELWKKLLPDSIILAPCIDCAASSGWNMAVAEMEESLDNGFAATYYYGGANTIYLYNHFPSTRYDGMQDFFACAGTRAEVEKRARRHIATAHDNLVEGRLSSHSFPYIWTKCCNGSVRINVGGASEGRSGKVVVAAKSPMEVDLLLNTVPCIELTDAENAAEGLPRLKTQNLYFKQFRIPKNAMHDGINAVELFNRSDKDLSDWCWAEIDIDPR